MASPNAPEKERLVKDDGRYIIFYDFEDESASEKNNAPESRGEQQ